MKRIIYSLTAFLISLLLIPACNNESLPLQTASIFNDRMVLQANHELNIWGTATPGAKIEIAFRNQISKIRTDKEGNWKIILQSETYGGPDSLVIKSKKQRLVFQDVLVGEVWVCSGQSNMEMPLISNWAKTNNAEEEVNAADYSEIRLFKVERKIAFQPVTSLKSEGWEICNSENITDFSAVAYFFGQDIPFSSPMYETLKVENDKIVLSFNYTYDGLSTSDKANPKGFSIAGEDKVFYLAQAIIDGNSVTVSSKKVSKPVAVRYGWATNPDCNMRNSEGLPMSPFRTDLWKGITE